MRKHKSLLGGVVFSIKANIDLQILTDEDLIVVL